MNKKSNSEVLKELKITHIKGQGLFLLENDRIVELKGRVLDGDSKKIHTGTSLWLECFTRANQKKVKSY